MPDRTSNDPNVTAARILRRTTGEEPESIEEVLAELRHRLTPEQLRTLAAAILGEKGGKKGGRARAQKLSAERRSEIARKAAKARWSESKRR